MDIEQTSYAARLEVDYPEESNRLTTFFRLILAIPIVIVLSIISATADSTYVVISEAGEAVSKITTTSGGIAGALFLATLLMILFRQRYPRWWFDFSREFARFAIVSVSEQAFFRWPGVGYRNSAPPHEMPQLRRHKNTISECVVKSVNVYIGFLAFCGRKTLFNLLLQFGDGVLLLADLFGVQFDAVARGDHR